ncbi:hypothetical protein FISHEDRAFT_76631 [Fistulina hepatica ATCC 64428]|uniref:Uncharacterized protein n=1 Tax=Fistulina hepatica ATCC 64428 TaxID=1128425 RepID=A0A0D7A401_9AGAR|nr:hypothetical protein FISHEDRAFT_76631 [Fistulina hepatica ATCC 64428]
MSPPFDRAELQKLKRTQLQQLCKDCGVKANLKSDALIEELLAWEGELPDNARKTSKKMLRSTSIIIHDTDEEDSHDEHNEPVIEAQPAPSRTRKAKETQFRLGVGRPIAAGGNGARVVTRTATQSRAKRGKASSKAAIPVEPTIEEEPEQIEQPEQLAKKNGSQGAPPQASSRGSKEADVNKSPNGCQNSDLKGSVPGSQDLEPLLAIVLKPFQAQLDTLQRSFTSVLAELDNAKKALTEVETLKRRLDEVNNELAEMKQQLSRLDDLDSIRQRIDELEVGVRAVSNEVEHIPRDEVAFRSAEFMSELDTLKRHITDMERRHTTARVPLASLDYIPTTPPRSRQQSNSDNPFLVQPKEQSSGSRSLFHVSQDAVPAQPRPSTPPVHQHPGVTRSLLGKRHRDSVSSAVAGVVDAVQAASLSPEKRARTVLRPRRKKARIGDVDGYQDDSIGMLAAANPHAPLSEDDGEEDVAAVQGPPQLKPFTVFTDPQDGADRMHVKVNFNAPPSKRLPRYYGPLASEAGPSRRPGARQMAENRAQLESQEADNAFLQHTPAPFDTPFLPAVESTPTVPCAFDVLDKNGNIEAPSSPTPACDMAPYIEDDPDRTDVFREFGFPSPSRRAKSSSGDQTPTRKGRGLAWNPETPAWGGSEPIAVWNDKANESPEKELDPAALVADYREYGKRLTSNDMGRGLGLLNVPPRMTPSEVAAAAGGSIPTRTMYGTELDKDKRFGDFGIDGVASGFWSGGRR